jgi:hypothetical protein
MALRSMMFITRVRFDYCGVCRDDFAIGTALL